MPNRGEILEKYIRANSVNLTQLATKLPWTSKTIYRHFETPGLDIEKVLIYSEALNHDFSDDIPEMAAYKHRVAEPPLDYRKSKGSLSEAEYYRTKYESLLEKYTDLQAQHIRLLQQRETEKG
jgi:hypothetical protein